MSVGVEGGFSLSLLFFYIYFVLTVFYDADFCSLWGDVSGFD